MPKDPLSIFGSLLAACISDAYRTQDRGIMVEGVVFLAFGAAASLATTWLLSSFGLLV
jgi:sugar phosphate permease